MTPIWASFFLMEACQPHSMAGVRSRATMPYFSLRSPPVCFLHRGEREWLHNLGAIIRTADAVGAHGIIVRERRAVGLTPAVEKSSAGALEYIPVTRVVNISRTIETLKNNNIWVIGIDQSGKTEYSEIDYKPATAIVIGAEGQGLSDLVCKNCDFLASIPMYGHISSLNASVAAAVVMYEVVKQRK